jgi:molecular chaperone GrpE
MATKDPKDEAPEPRDHEAQDSGEPKVHDKRKIDPETGEVRPQADEADEPDAATDLSDDDLALLADAERDLVAEYRERAARAEAELKNFRTRVERDRAATREAVIAEVIRSLLPTIDDLDRAEEHGDLVEGSPLTIVAQKLRAGFERYGLTRVGEKGDPFDPKLHEAIAQVYSKDVTAETVADVIEPGYALGERLLRPAKVAVSVPEPS